MLLIVIPTSIPIPIISSSSGSSGLVGLYDKLKPGHDLSDIDVDIKMLMLILI